MIPAENFYYIGAALFSIGLAIVITKRNAIMILMGIELMLNASNINFLAYNRAGSLDGQFFALFVIVVAAAEASVALAIVLKVYKHFKTINLDKIADIKD
ncbi:MAG: NADH-quinone oxidoreductase subunit NuoK [Bacteroidota bacterium]